MIEASDHAFQHQVLQAKFGDLLTDLFPAAGRFYQRHYDPRCRPNSDLSAVAAHKLTYEHDMIALKFIADEEDWYARINSFLISIYEGNSNI